MSRCSRRPPSGALSASERSSADDLTSETNGNPFFLLQILRHLLESGTIVAGAEAGTLTARP